MGFMEYVWAFVIGGIICVIGQILLDTTMLTAPRILVIFVVSGVVLQALGLYHPLVDLAGNGATVPLPGFGYNLAKGAMEGAKEGFIPAITGPLENSAAVFTGSLLKKMEKGRLNRILLMSTGALLSTISPFQGESIPGIAHAIALEVE